MLLKKRKREECSGISCDVVASTAGIRRVAVCSIFFCFFTISFFLLLGKPLILKYSWLNLLQVKPAEPYFAC